jgi:hypothetical protein
MVAKYGVGLSLYQIVCYLACAQSRILRAVWRFAEVGVECHPDQIAIGDGPRVDIR